ncbi:MAG: hypothetical protein ACLU48_13750 [Clostridiaceae bacterium]
MKYINQLEHRDIPYEHNLDHGGVPEEKRNVAAAGCGPSCLCMMVDALTLSTYELTDCLKLSNEVGANREIGTSLKILGPVVAERFNLNYGETSDLNELKAHLAKGGLAIANSGGDREGYTGVFTHGGHYILVVSADDNEACILDPSYKEGKYEEPGRDGKARAVDGFVYCSLKVLAEDCANRTRPTICFQESIKNMKSAAAGKWKSSAPGTAAHLCEDADHRKRPRGTPEGARTHASLV